MNCITFTVLFFICKVLAFQAHPKSDFSVSKRNTLQMGFFDFKPIHGSGSARPEDLEEQYQIQQELLEARRDHINHDSFHEKYSKEDPTHSSDVFSLGNRMIPDKFSESYVDENQIQKKELKIKFPWDIKP
jgi:hypothetical protein